MTEFIGVDDKLLMSAEVSVDNDSAVFESADAAYEAWCLELGIDSAVSLGSFNGDEVSQPYLDVGEFLVDEDVEWEKSFMMSSEGAIGFYDYPNSSNSGGAVTSIPGISRLRLTTVTPALVFTWHPPTDCKSYGSKWNKSANGYCIRASFQRYSGTTYTIHTAVKVSETGMEVFIENTSAGIIPLYALAFPGAGSTSNVPVNQYLLGETGPNATNTFLAVTWQPFEYKTEGRVIYGPYELPNVSSFRDSAIRWNASIPVDTSMEVFFGTSTSAAEPTNWVLCENHSPLTGLVGNRNLYIKVEMSSTTVTRSPSLSALNIYLEGADNRKVLQLFIKPLDNIRNIVGPVTVEYDTTVGRLMGLGGKVLSFSEDFVPTDLVQKNNPHDVEHLEAAITDVLFSPMKVYYTYTNNREYLQAGITEINFEVTKVGTDPL